MPLPRGRAFASVLACTRLERVRPEVYKIYMACILRSIMTKNRFPTITEASIAVLIDAFYARVRRDPALGPIFETAIAEDGWPEHLETMRRFGSSAMLTSRRYSGNQVAVHHAVTGIERSLFADWPALFTQIASELFEFGPASEFAAKAQRIAISLQLALFHRPGGSPEGLTRKPAA
jgi:hemoglobin